MDQAGADTDDVGDRVQRPDLVEVHVVGVGAVHGRLGDREPVERVVRPHPDVLVQPGLGEQGADVGPGAVRDAVRDLDVAAGRGEPVAGHALGDDRDVLGCHRLDRVGDHPDRDAGAHQRTEQHVAARPRRRVDPADHGAEPRFVCDVWGDSRGRSADESLCGRALRATRAANTPAPKPLSMLTTVTPGAQELSIAEQRGEPAERGAVADAGGHRDERRRRSARRPRWAARPPCRPPRPGSRPRRGPRARPAPGAGRRRRRR